MQPLNSAITGALAAVTPRESTGQPHGKTELSISGSENAKSWLLAQSGPEAADKALLASLGSLLGSEVCLRTELRFPEGRPAYSVAVGADFAASGQDDVTRALQRMHGAMARPERIEAENWFAAMRLATAGGQKADFDVMATMKLYVAELSAYPADVVRAVFKKFTTAPRDATSWFPTLPELIAEAERLVSTRRALISALTKWRPEDDEDRKQARIRSLLLDVKELEDSVFLKKRGQPEVYAEAMARAKVMRDEAAALRRGEPWPKPEEDVV